jgi:hypothetical protein
MTILNIESRKKTLDSFFSSGKDFFLYVIAAMPLLPYGILSVALISYAVCLSATVFTRSLKGPDKQDYYYFISQFLFYFLFALSFFWSTDGRSSLNIVQHSLPAALFPFLSIISPSLSANNIRSVVKVFVGSSTVLALYITTYFLVKYDLGYIFGGSIVYNVLKADFLYLDIHPIFTSLFFVFSIVLLLENISKQSKNGRILGHLILILILLTPIVLLASKAILLVLAVAIVHVLLVNKNFKAKRKIQLAVVFFLVFLGFLQSPMLRNRMMSFIGFFVEGQSQDGMSSSTSLRMHIYNCSFQIAQNNIWLGVGLGDVQQYLDRCLEQSGSFGSVMSAHNFYIRVLLSCGIFGLLFFFGSIGYNFYLYLFKRKSVHFGVFLVAFAFIMLFEDYLIRSYGVTLYAFTNHIFYLVKNEE